MGRVPSGCVTRCVARRCVRRFDANLTAWPRDATGDAPGVNPPEHTQKLDHREICSEPRHEGLNVLKVSTCPHHLSHRCGNQVRLPSQTFLPRGRTQNGDCLVSKCCHTVSRRSKQEQSSSPGIGSSEP